MASPFSKTYVKKNLIQTLPNDQICDFRCLEILRLVEQCRKIEKDKNFCLESTLSEEGQMICCSSKKVDRTLSLSHFLANKIAGKPVRISHHVLVCWYELTVQFYRSSICMHMG